MGWGWDITICAPSCAIGTIGSSRTVIRTTLRGCTWTTEFTSGRAFMMEEWILTSEHWVDLAGPSTL